MDHTQIHEVYQLFDTDGDGLSIKELGRALRSVGIFLSRSEVRSMLRDFDESGDGHLDLHEFTSLCEKLGEECIESDDDDDDVCNGGTRDLRGQPPQPKCPEGHHLRERKTNPPGYGSAPAACNLCNQSVDFPHGFRHCPTCQYDVCHRCLVIAPPATCAKGHAMATLVVDPPEYGGANANCDGCNTLIDSKKTMSHCAICKYDLCRKCTLARQHSPAVPLPPPPPPKPVTPAAGVPSAAVGAPPSSGPSVKGTKALFIGINYVGQSHALRGCANDVRTMQHLLKFLKTPVRESRVLSDDSTCPGVTGQPTKANIESGMDWLIKGSVAGDSLFLHYSGHGTQVRGSTAEADGKDEALCPCDMDHAGVIADDVLFNKLVRNLPGGVRLTVVMDCCHSGSMLDLPVTFSGSRDGTAYARSVGVVMATSRDGAAAIKGSVFCISGCSDDQTSADVSTVSGFKLNSGVQSHHGAGGALTHALAESLCEHPEESLVDLMDAMRGVMKQRGFSQVPQLSATKSINANDKFKIFGGA